MKFLRVKNLFFLFFLISSNLIYGADDLKNDSSVLMDSSKKKIFKTSGNVLFLEQLPSSEEGTQSSIHFRAGVINVGSLKFSNSYYLFSYPDRTQFATVGFAIESMPYKFLGHFGGRVDVGYGYGSTSLRLNSNESAGRVRLQLLPLIVSVVYVPDLKPMLNWMSPSLTVGGGFLGYFQSGDLDGTQSRGGNIIFSASAGLRVDLEGIGFSGSQLTLDYQRSQKSEFSGTSYLFGIVSQI